MESSIDMYINKQSEADGKGQWILCLWEDFFLLLTKDINELLRLSSYGRFPPLNLSIENPTAIHDTPQLDISESINRDQIRAIHGPRLIQN